MKFLKSPFLNKPPFSIESQTRDDRVFNKLRGGGGGRIIMVH